VKILFIAYSVGGTSSSGKVVSALLEVLVSQKNFEIILLYGQGNFDFHPEYSLKIKSRHRSSLSFYEKIKLIACDCDQYASKWVKKGLYLLKKVESINDIDFAVVVGSAYAYQGYELAYEVYKRFRIPYHIHGLDPIPSVPAWGEHPLLRSALVRYIKPFYEKADSFSAISSEMVEYQRQILNVPKKKSFTLLNPCAIDRPNDVNKIKNQNTFSITYLGSLNKKRNPKEVISMFRKVRLKGYDIKLSFYGDLHGLDKIDFQREKDWVSFYSYTSDLDLVLKKTDYFLDIDAKIENDVFISGKIMQYISWPKPIIIFTLFDSPTSNLLKECNESICKLYYEDDTNLKRLLSFLSKKLYCVHDRNSLLNKSHPIALVKKLKLKLIGYNL